MNNAQPRFELTENNVSLERINQMLREAQGVIAVMSTSTNTGQGATFQYDGSGRIIRITLADGTQWQYTYDGNGRISTETDGTVTFAFSYDGSGRIVQIA